MKRMRYCLLSRSFFAKLPTVGQNCSCVVRRICFVTPSYHMNTVAIHNIKTPIIKICHVQSSLLFNKKYLYTSQNQHKRENGITKWIEDMSTKLDRTLDAQAPAVKEYMDYLKSGMKSEWSNLKQYRHIRAKQKEYPYSKTSYKEDMIVYMVNRNLIKVLPLFTIAMLPMGFFLVFIPIYLFPRFVLPQSFWTTRQRQQILSQIHNDRVHHYGIILHHLNYHMTNSSDGTLRTVLENLHYTISKGNVPCNNQVMALRPFCRELGNPLNGDQMVYLLLRAFCYTIMVTPYQPPTFIQHRLRSNANLVLNLDKKIVKENLLKKFTPQERIYACLMRGLDSAQLTQEANAYWLKNWIALTQNCDDGDAWFVLHAMVLLSVNYSELKFKRRVFD